MGFVDTLRDWQERHRRFVKRVHNFRIPLSPTGQRIAQVVYFSIPVIGGYFIMDWATSKAREEIEFSDGSSNSSISSNRAGAAGAVASEDPGKVLENMRINPEGRAEQQGIRAQNETMRQYLDSLRRQGQQRP